MVYRFIIAGSVEEKMYEKQVCLELLFSPCTGLRVAQVFKDGLRVTSERGKTSERYFSDKETRELFRLSPPGIMSYGVPVLISYSLSVYVTRSIPCVSEDVQT